MPTRMRGLPPTISILTIPPLELSLLPPSRAVNIPVLSLSGSLEGHCIIDTILVDVLYLISVLSVLASQSLCEPMKHPSGRHARDA
ncbi:hypothetical protein BJY52DRAFT_66292 [Lactarius psammicola]|nr:hypothetical protein BJY52DRAFT_66292 [Lactarius psammicola]